MHNSTSPCSLYGSLWHSRNSVGKTALVLGPLIETGLLIATHLVVNSSSEEAWTKIQMIGLDFVVAAVAGYGVYKGKKEGAVVENSNSDNLEMVPFSHDTVYITSASSNSASP